MLLEQDGPILFLVCISDLLFEHLVNTVFQIYAAVISTLNSFWVKASNQKQPEKLVRNHITYNTEIWLSKYHIKIDASKCEAVNSKHKLWDIKAVKTVQSTCKRKKCKAVLYVDR